MAAVNSTKSRERALWHHQPDVPIGITPLFDWPPRPLAALRWLAYNWLRLSPMLIAVGLAFLIYRFFHPDPSVMQNLSAGWIGQIWLRNIILAIVVAGSLHTYLYIFRKQGDKLKFEKRDLDRNNKLFTFNNQVRDNMFWTLASGVTIWTSYEVIYFWASSNQWVPAFGFAQNPIWFIAMFAVIPMWSSFHFYWIHKLLHWPPLFRVAHALHHRNVNVGPWSGISMHPIEHVLYFSSFTVHFIVASHPLHFIFHAYYQALQPMASHSGYAGLMPKDKKHMKLGDFFHQLHHRHYKCNYGTCEMPWDRWFGSFHDGTDEATRRIRKRKF